MEYNKSKSLPCAGVAELADAPDLGSGGQPCRFKSCRPHHPKKTKKIFGQKTAEPRGFLHLESLDFESAKTWMAGKRKIDSNPRKKEKSKSGFHKEPLFEIMNALNWPTGYRHKSCAASFQGRQSSAEVPTGSRSNKNWKYRKGRRPLALAVSTIE